MSLIERKVWRTDKNFSNGSRDINRFNSIGVVRTSDKRFIASISYALWIGLEEIDVSVM